MILSMSRQAILFLSTVCAGAAIGLVYDIFRIFRKTAPHKPAAVQAEDLLYWLAATAMVFYFMLNQNYGEIRFHSLLGIALGMILYFASVSALVIKISVIIINFLKKVITAALRLLLWPIRLIIRLLAPPTKWLARFIRSRLREARVYGRIKLKKTARQWRIIRKKV